MTFIRLMPYILSILTLFPLIIDYQVGINLYIPIGGMFIILLAFKSLISKQPLQSVMQKQIVPLVFFIAFFLLLLGLQTLSYTFHESFDLAFKSTFTLIWIPVFFILFSVNVRDFNWYDFAKFQIVLGIIVIIMGIIQRFYSLDLFGLIPNIKGQEYYISNLDRLRVGSFLGSSQVFGLYCTLLAIIVLDHIPNLHGTLRGFIFICLIGSGILSGNKSIIAIMFTYSILRFQSMKQNVFLKRILIIIASVVIIAVGLQHIHNYQADISSTIYRPFIWLLDYDQFAEEEKTGRLSIYQNIWNQTNPIWGEGLGCTAPTINGRHITPESYFLQVYVEGGFIPLICLLTFISLSVRRSKRFQSRCCYYLVVCIGVSWIFVHAFIAPVFFPFWGFIIGEALSNNEYI